MAVVQIAHRRHKANALIFGAPRKGLLLHVCGGVDDLKAHDNWPLQK